MKQLLCRLLRRNGCSLVHYAPRDLLREAFPDLADAERVILRRVQPFTMTGTERLVAAFLRGHGFSLFNGRALMPCAADVPYTLLAVRDDLRSRHPANDVRAI